MLSPCIISKAKYALGLKLKKPLNSKKCSLRYWREVLTILSGSKITLDEQFVTQSYYELICRV